MKRITIVILLMAAGMLPVYSQAPKKCFLFENGEDVISVTLEINGEVVKGNISSQSKLGSEPLFPSSTIRQGRLEGVRMIFKTYPSRKEIIDRGNDSDIERIWIFMEDKITIPRTDGSKPFLLTKIDC